MEHSQHHHAHFALENMHIHDLLSFLTVLAASLSMSWHCAAMCGPLACSIMGKDTRWSQANIWVYNLGRVISYTTMGILLASLLAEIHTQFQAIGTSISLLLGLTICLAGLKQFISISKLSSLNKINSALIQKLFSKLQSLPQLWKHLSLGLVSVLLPCVSLTPMLALSASTKSATQAGLLMFSFALGTIPAMVIATNVPLGLRGILPQKFKESILGILLILSGIITIVRVFPH